MNLKKLFTLVALFVVLVASSTFAQTTYFVDVQNGLDGYNGLQQTVGIAPNGPKATITNAIAAASDGDIISVAYANGNLYNENINYVVLAAGPNKRLTFTSTGGAPNVVSFTLNSNNAWSPNNFVTFTGPFTITTGLTLTDGQIKGASNLTVGTFVSRNSATPLFGSVDSQLNFTGTVAFFYTGGSAVTTGGEIVPAANTTNMGNLTTATGAVTLNSSKTMSGILATGGVLAIGSANTLTINGQNAHTVAGNVTGGTLAFSMATGNASVTGNFNLPAVTATTTTTTPRTLDLPTSTSIGTLTVSGAASVTALNAVTVGATSNSGTQPVVLFTTSAAATTVASVSNTGSGSVTLNTPAALNLTVTGNIAQSGSGFVAVAPVVSTGGTVSVGGTVTNNPTLTLSAATINAASNRGVIIFGDRPVTVTGLITVAPVYTGSATRNNAGAETNWSNTGEVRFLSLSATATSTTTLTGGVTINPSYTSVTAVDAGLAAGAASVSNNGNLIFTAAVVDNILIPGPITISTSWAAITNITMANNGNFSSAARTGTSSFGTGASRVGAINVTSTGTNGANGNFLPGTGAGFFGTSVTTSGGTGGYITFGNDAVSFSGNVTNSRSSNAAHLNFGTALTAGINVQIGGNLTNNGISQINFIAFNGAAAESFTVTGAVNVSSGTVAVNAAAPLSGTGTFQFGSVNLTGGLLDLTGAGTSNMDVIINGNASFTAGTLDCVGAAALTTNISVTPVVVLAADRVLQLGGLTNTFSSATGTTTFTTTNTLLLIQPMTIVAAQTVTANLTQTIWPGIALVKNPTGLMPAVTFSGGNMRFLGGLAFDLSQVNVNNVTLFIGGQLAPNVGTGHFYNHAGYTTTGQGFVSMNNQLAGGIFGGAGTFENFEVDCLVSASAAVGSGAFTKTFNLTNGNVLTAGNVVFNNATVYPTIVRNAGTFGLPPTFTSMVDVIYIGLDKTTANELPLLPNRLNNLTVATTNDGTAPLIAGQGAVTCGVATTVNGTLNIYNGQALVIKGVVLTMNGASINLNTSGLLADDGVGSLALNRATGTLISGSGWLPSITVNPLSIGNKIDGAKGLVSNFLGTDDSFGGLGVAADFDPTAAQASGNLVFGAGAAELEVVFGSGALNGTNLNNVTTADAANTFTVSSNLTSGGNLTHAAGTVAIGTGFTWSYRGLAPNLTTGSVITGPGTLAFRVGPTLLTTVVGNATIAAPVVINLGASGTAFTIDPLGAGGLILSDNFTLTQGTVVLGSGTVARNLTLTGSNFTMASTASFQVVDVPAGPVANFIQGALILNPTTAPLTWTTGAATLGKLTISNDVALSGTGAITVQNTFTHNGGNLNFGSRNITIDGLTDLDPGAPVWAAGGTFNRTATTATYTATTGYLIIRTAVFNQGTGFSIPNLRFGSLSDAVSPTFGTAQNATVTTNLYVDIATANTITHTVGAVARLNVSDGATVTWNEGKFDVVPVYAGTIKLTVVNTGGRAIDATVWPAVAALVTTLNINNTAAASLAGGRTVNTQLTLTAGNLNLAAAAQVLTLANDLTVQVVAGTLTLAGGSVVYGTGMNYNYAVNAIYGTGAELTPSTTPINNLTFTRTLTTAANAATTINKSITVNGTLTIKNDVTIPATPPAPVIVVTANGNVIIANESATFANATNPVTTFNQSMVFGGANTNLTVPAATPPVNIGAITINKTANTNTLTLVGGNVATGTITFVKGNIVTGSNILYIPAPTLNLFPAAVSQGFTGAGSNSMVVGNVAKTLVNTGALGFSTEATNIFPVGTGVVYRPASLTFNPAFGVPTTPNATIVVSHMNSNPGGSSGLPITNGVATGINVSRYPAFYWNIYTVGSVGQSTVFDLGLTAGNFTDFDAPANVRIIRRHGAVADVNNEWLLQGINTGYDNEVNAVTGFTAINRNSVGGLRTGGAVFTLGVKSNISVKTAIAKQWLVIPQGAKLVSLVNTFQGNQGTLAFTVQSSNPAVTTAEIIGTSVKLTPLTIGEAVVTITAQDKVDNVVIDNFSYSFSVDSRMTDVETAEAIPTEFALMQNFPNPFNPTTNIKFALPTESNVSLKIYNVLGEEVATLINKVMPAGFHTYNFDATRLSSGMYIYRIEAGSFVQVKKLMLMK